MRILIHKDIYEDDRLFEEVANFVLYGQKMSSMTFIWDFQTMRFDLTYDEQRNYDRQSYIELSKDTMKYEKEAA